MTTTSECKDYRNRSLVLKGIGLLFLMAGTAAAFIGPLEIYTFYQFTTEGRFHYSGFEFGSFMFAYIAIQVVGYYAIAVIGILLGYGHLMLKRWSQALSLTLLSLWLLLGLPLTVITLLMLFESKELPVAARVIFLVLIPVFYPVIPLLLTRFYKSRGVTNTLQHADPQVHWLEQIPNPVRVVCGLLLFYLILLHLPMLLHGLFPWFGTLLVDSTGIIALDTAVLTLALLTWGAARLKLWAWWGSLIAFAVMIISSIITLSKYTVGDVLHVMRLPASEMRLFQGIPFLDWHPTVIPVIPLLGTLVIILVAGRYFVTSRSKP